MSTENQREFKIRGETFGDRVRNLRAHLGITQPELAEKLGITKGAVGVWESKPNSKANPETLRKIADLVNVAPEEFLQGLKGEGTMYRLHEDNQNIGDLPTAQKCREHLNSFLQNCTKPEQIAWTYCELQERFPLKKFKPKGDDQI